MREFYSFVRSFSSGAPEASCPTGELLLDPSSPLFTMPCTASLTSCRQLLIASPPRDSGNRLRFSAPRMTFRPYRPARPGTFRIFLSCSVQQHRGVKLGCTPSLSSKRQHSALRAEMSRSCQHPTATPIRYLKQKTNSPSVQAFIQYGVRPISLFVRFQPLW